MPSATKAGEVPPGAVRPFRLPPDRPTRRRMVPAAGRGGTTGRAGRHHWPPVVAVAAVVVGTQAVSAIHGHGPHRPGERAGRPEVRDCRRHRTIVAGPQRSYGGCRGPGRPAYRAGQPGASTLPGRDGRTYVGGCERPKTAATMWSRSTGPIPRRSWLHQFSVNSQGRPRRGEPAAGDGPPYGGLWWATWRSAATGGSLADTRLLRPCGSKRKSLPSDIGIRNMVVTGQAKQWTSPRAPQSDDVSLNANGSLPLYSLQLDPSVVRIIPASAPPGPRFADRGRTLLQAAQFGRSQMDLLRRDSRQTALPPASASTPPEAAAPERYLRGPPRHRAPRGPWPAAQHTPASSPATRAPATRCSTCRVAWAKLNLATGKVTYLPGWKAPLSEP